MKRVKIVTSLLKDIIDDVVCASYTDDTINYDKLITDLQYIYDELRIGNYNRGELK